MSPNQPAPQVLIADDQPAVLDALRLLLKEEGWRVVTAARPVEISRAVEAHTLDAVLMDLNYARDTTSGKEGLDLLARRCSALDATLPDHRDDRVGSVEGAVEAMRRGARDYVEKPWDNARLVAMLRTQVELWRARCDQRSGSPTENTAPRAERSCRRDRRVARDAAGAASSSSASRRPTPTCSSPASTARARRSSRAGSTPRRTRAARPFVAVNAGGLSEGVFESELFGHVKGAFTDAKTDRVGCFELADGGTLFLDEIANMPLAQQAKLLRVLQTGEFQRVGLVATRRVDVRVLAGDERGHRRPRSPRAASAKTCCIG